MRIRKRKKVFFQASRLKIHSVWIMAADIFKGNNYAANNY